MNEAFRPTCSTYVLIADATAPIGIRGERQVGGYGLVQVQFMNTGNALAYIGYGATPEEAQTNAVVPTAGNPTYVLPIFPRCAIAHSFSPGTYFSGIASEAATILITDGEGA